LIILFEITKEDTSQIQKIVGDITIPTGINTFALWKLCQLGSIFRGESISVRRNCYTNDVPVLSYLHGYVGRGWVDDLTNPSCTRIIVDEFCYFFGNHNSAAAENLVKDVPKDKRWLTMIPQNDGWGSIIESAFLENARKFPRYRINFDKNKIDREKLQSYIDNLSPEYSLVQIDENVYQRTLGDEVAIEWYSLYQSAKDYVQRGLGYCIFKGDELVSGASSCISCNGGIEIQIDTKESFQRKGLATVCAAKLVLECLDRNIYPRWDADCKESLMLAEKLGYEFDCEYDVYSVKNF